MGIRRIEIENTFHNTHTMLLARDGQISQRAYAGAMRRLCGIDGCCCAGHNRIVTPKIDLEQGEHHGPWTVVEVDR